MSAQGWDGCPCQKVHLVEMLCRRVRPAGERVIANADDGSAMLKPCLLRAETITAFQTPGRLVSGASTTYALGWTVASVQLAGEPARMVSHRGSPMGGTVSLQTFPDLGLAIAAAANANAKGVDLFARHVAEAFARHQNRR
jgi:Beta-lactamase